MRHTLLSLLAAILVGMGCATSYAQTSPRHPSQIIPLPTKVTDGKGTFTFPTGKATIFIKGSVSDNFHSYLKTCPLSLTPVSNAAKASIKVTVSTKAAKTAAANTAEGYLMTISAKGISIVSATETGAFYALQTILQLVGDATTPIEMACCTVEDSPYYTYRGLHFDVSRHFRSKDFLLKQIDAMSLLKLNRMHLHLTDAAGWRLQIDRYPRLTDFAAWRPQRTWTSWAENGSKYCDKGSGWAYGGYYTKDDIRDILAYASARHITVIPEIEMPGHSEEVMAAYPELSCSGKPYVNGDFCAGKEATFEFLENVLDEVIALFPSEYIHIGGDEASKAGWKDCPDCQKRMKDEGLGSVDELQSYFIQRIERFVNSKGRQIIGWDEILQGGLAPNATVMSWRGTEGGIKAMRQGHHVVMTPGEYYYLDYTQDASFKEPNSIGGYSPLKNVYSYNPGATLTPEEAKYLLGVQGNLWTEYVTDDAHAEYMYFPRAFAVAETGWSRPEAKNYDDFHGRALSLNSLLQHKGYHTFDLANEYGERKESLAPINHLAKGCKVTYNLPYSNQWPGPGDTALTDGSFGGWTYLDKKWQGVMTDFDITIDLGQISPIHYVGATFMHSAGAWVYVPKRVDISVSADGKEFKAVGTAWGDVPDDFPKLLFKLYAVTCNEQARYIRLHAVKNDKPGVWLFTDEVVVN